MSEKKKRCRRHVFVCSKWFTKKKKKNKKQGTKTKEEKQEAFVHIYTPDGGFFFNVIYPRCMSKSARSCFQHQYRIKWVCEWQYINVLCVVCTVNPMYSICMCVPLFCNHFLKIRVACLFAPKFPLKYIKKKKTKITASENRTAERIYSKQIAQTTKWKTSENQRHIWNIYLYRNQ